MLEQPNTQQQMPQPEKLVLPAYPDAGQRMDGSRQPLAASGYSMHQSTLPPVTTFSNPLRMLQAFWRKDAAYKVLLIALALVVVSGFLFMILGSTTLLQGLGTFNQNAVTPQNPSAEVPASGTVDLHPTFPTPSGGNGSNTSSLPPPGSSNYPTPDVTPPDQPTPPPGGALTVQISSIPSQVSNRSRVEVGVNTSQPQVVVRLQVYYNAPPYAYYSAQSITDGGGNATLVWHVNVSGRGLGQVVATVYAVAVDQNGQRVLSQAVQVLVVNNGFGG